MFFLFFDYKFETVLYAMRSGGFLCMEIYYFCFVTLLLFWLIYFLQIQNGSLVQEDTNIGFNWWENEYIQVFTEMIDANRGMQEYGNGIGLKTYNVCSLWWSKLLLKHYQHLFKRSIETDTHYDATCYIIAPVGLSLLGHNLWTTWPHHTMSKCTTWFWAGGNNHNELI